MIEKKFLLTKLKEFQIEEFISSNLNKAGYSHTEIQRTPLGEKVIIYTSRPGLIVGSRGSNLQKLTEVLKKRFKMENPQIEVSEISQPLLNPRSVAKTIVHSFERFGPRRFKSTGYKVLQSIMSAGATGAEIVISGRGIPSKRSKTWRFSAGYLKKSGDISENFVKYGFSIAHLKSGAIGVKVKILTPDVKLPDKITILKSQSQEIEEKPKEEPKKEEQKKEKPKKETKKKTTKKSKPKKEKPKDGNNTKK